MAANTVRVQTTGTTNTIVAICIDLQTPQKEFFRTITVIK